MLHSRLLFPVVQHSRFTVITTLIHLFVVVTFLRWWWSIYTFAFTAIPFVRVTVPVTVVTDLLFIHPSIPVDVIVH